MLGNSGTTRAKRYKQTTLPLRKIYRYEDFYRHSTIKSVTGNSGKCTGTCPPLVTMYPPGGGGPSYILSVRTET